MFILPKNSQQHTIRKNMIRIAEACVFVCVITFATIRPWATAKNTFSDYVAVGLTAGIHAHAYHMV